MKTIGNIIWFLFGGVFMGLAWWFFSLGQEAISRDELTNEMVIGTSPLGVIGNVMSAVACFITIIGIPFAIQHLKLAVISLAPIGKTVVDKREA
ncbi:hypothetical protein LTQ03_17445 [Vibrio splendidus]|uniref:YccF domain-containing protein n=1 Tax=Vibrio splendidus TaxID=29497 RepID=UPI001FB33069|nr:YccF domain-containing protein [Vibrio splendidus]UOE82512.1 hypothetical protein LTQ03_17445 [Vibrio splendidus]